MKTAHVVVAALLLVVGCGENTDGISTPLKGYVAQIDSATTVPTKFDPEKFRSDPKVVGSFNVGFRQWQHTYRSSVTDKDRKIAISVWYPTKSNDGDTVVYLPSQPSTEDELVFGNAPLATTAVESKLPVLVFSHGHIAWAGASAHVARYFASKGWVVVGPDHTDNTLADNIEPRVASIYAHRGLDISATLDALSTLPVTDPLAGRLFLDRVIAHGHSFGGYTMWAVAGAEYTEIEAKCAELSDEPESACSNNLKVVLGEGLRDRRVIGVALTGHALDRSWFGDGKPTGIDIPMLILSGEDDDPHEDLLAYWDSFGGLDVSRLNIKGGCHPTFESSILASEGSCAIGLQLGYDIENTYKYAFAQRYLLGSDQPTLGLLSGSVKPYAEAQIHKR